MSAVSDTEKTFRFMTLFGLPSGFDGDELTRAYRTLAKLNHPDTSDDPESVMRMVIINEGYSFLKGQLQNGLSAPNTESTAVHDPAYTVYKSAFTEMSTAFADYYGEGSSSRAHNIDMLREGLYAAKSGFAECIERYPSSRWTADAIDRIFSINKWLD